ncbi:MAG: MmgE/PrpD family protein [Acidobacteriota bacterium]|nr:MmgE/PrpD family protein [Acidobacteriota bacterium]
MTLEKQLVDFAVNTRLEDIPERTVAFSKQLLAKISASMVKGSGTDSAKKLIRILDEQGNSDRRAPLIGCGLRSSVDEASFINGYFAHAAELEDDQFPSATSDITVVPIIFSMIEAYGLTGRDVLEATTVAMEVMNRIGTYSLASKGIVELPFYGVVGAAIAAGKAMRLGTEEMLGAIGIAMGRASGLISNFGTDAHYIESALACRDGLLAAVLAKGGMSGNPDLSTWLTNLVGADKFDPQVVVGDLGKKWRIHTVWIKKYPCCFLTHRPIDILFRLRHTTPFQEAEVVDLTIEDNPVSKIVDRPVPVHTDDARFSFQQALSAALLDGEVDDHHFSPQRIADPAFVATRRKIKIVRHEDWPKAFLSGPCRVTVRLRDGRELKGESETAGGAPDSPLTEQEVHDLFRRILKPVMPSAGIEATWKTIASLESQQDLKPFLEGLRHVPQQNVAERQAAR